MKIDDRSQEDTGHTEFLYRGYTITCIYGKVTQQLKEEIVSLWQNAGVMSLSEAQRRTGEVVMTVRNGAGELIGVNTVYVGDFLKKNNLYFFYRVFIRPQDRGQFGLHGFLGKKAREFLRQHSRHSGPKGVVAVAENRKIMSLGGRRLMERNGWNYYGKGPRGYDVWYINFDGSQLDLS